ncbi:LysR family transcriptional regulator [Roseivivax sp. CAU 1753]
MRINYDFNDLEAFLAVKETGSFHLAAERLNLSQSAVTRRVKKLEQALDSLLFERTTRAVKPTLAAKRLQARAEAILDGAQETTRAMRDESAALSHQKTAILTIAVIPSVVPMLLVDAVRTFRAAGHSARLRILDRAANEVAEAVSSGEADFGICSIPMLEPATAFEPLFDDRIVLALPRDHPFCGRDVLRWADLVGDDLIVPARGTGNRLLIDEAMARSRQPVVWTFEVGRSTTALELVDAGIGIALLPRSSVASGFGRSTTWLPIESPEIARPVGLLTRSGQGESQMVTAFLTVLRQISRGQTRTRAT